MTAETEEPEQPAAAPERSLPGIVLLAAPGAITNIVHHALNQEFGRIQVVMEEPVPRLQLVRRRVRKLGLLRVTGQLLFMMVAIPWLRRTGAGRIEEIKRSCGLDDSPIGEDVVRVASVNSEEARQALRRLRPRVVVVNGTRIIAPATLSSLSVPFINMHAGITPLYRGVHGGYWALCEHRSELVGTTVHLVDAGIDTGAVIGQVTFGISDEDSFVTYPYLHTTAGLPLLIEAVRSALEGDPALKPARELPTRLRSHPTLWEYCSARLRSGVR